MKTLYITDLDGTLLRPDETVSAYTVQVLNRLIREGMLFSYATARGVMSAAPLLKDVRLSLPAIINNGTSIVDNATYQILHLEQFSPQEAEEIFSIFRENGLFPICYAIIEGKNSFSFVKEECGRAQWEFIRSRLYDGRAREIFSEEHALDGEVFYFVGIDDEARLKPIYEALKEKYRCFFAPDIYTGEYWLEVLPKGASKAAAAERLKFMLGCDKIVCFGDAKNDIPMFEIADECYAVENAAPELKAVATAVIGANTEDGVARFLEQRFIK